MSNLIISKQDASDLARCIKPKPHPKPTSIQGRLLKSLVRRTSSAYASEVAIRAIDSSFNDIAKYYLSPNMASYVTKSSVVALDVQLLTATVASKFNLKNPKLKEKSLLVAGSIVHDAIDQINQVPYVTPLYTVSVGQSGRLQLILNNLIDRLDI